MTITQNVLDKVKQFLNLEGTTIYDDKLKNIFIPSAIATLESEGVKQHAENEDHFNTWCICISLRCQMLMDTNAMTNENVLRLYITLVNEIRTL